MELDYLKHLSEMDESVLRELMKAYGQNVWDYAYVLTRRRDLADDVAQDVFISAYKNIGSFRGESSVKTWLLTITRNIALNYMRSAFFRRAVLFEWVGNKGAAQSAENEYLALAERDEIWDSVLSLPEKFREPLVLEAKYGMPIKEIAGLLGITEGTVKSRLHRARAKVSRMLKEAEGYEIV